MLNIPAIARPLYTSGLWNAYHNLLPPQFPINLLQSSHRSEASDQEDVYRCAFSEVTVSVETVGGVSAPTMTLYFPKCTTVLRIGCRKKQVATIS